MRGALAHVAVAADDRDLARHHHVGGALDAVSQRLAAAVEIVELRFGNGVVDVDGRNQQLALLHHLVEPVHARGGLFRYAAPVLDHLVPVLRVLGIDLLEQVLDHLLLVIAARRCHTQPSPFFKLIAFVDEQRRVAAVVHDELRALAALVRERVIRAPPVLFERLALPREDRNADSGNRGCGVILRGEDVAACPAHFRAETHQRLDQHRGLNGHVQRAGDAHAGQRLCRRIFIANRHQARHLLLGDGDFFAAPIGQAMSATL